MDPRNQIALAAMWGAMTDPREDHVPPEFIFNSDVTTLLLEDGVEEAYLAEGSSEKLKEHRKSASISKNTHKARGVSLLVTTSAAGTLVCTIVIIRDESFKKMTFYTVSNRNGLQQSLVTYDAD